ncbi:ABC transporter ATP-binding protein [Rhodococcus opacus]|nr:ABC transporter ATP-binding protein [Rhodococcus opacus]
MNQIDTLQVKPPAPSTATSNFVRFKDVTQTFTVSGTRPKPWQRARSSQVNALSKVNLEIPAGQFVALVGASGCGKTTLLNMLAGLQTPTTGNVTIRGATPTLPNLEIGYMFARDALLPWRTAQQNVELPLETRGWSAQRRHEKSAEMLELVGLGGRENQFPLQLSQGMRQRVSLARTLASDPAILLMDEPFAALDARTKLTLQAEFLRIWEQHQGSEQHKTVVFVTHDLQEAVILADRVVLMVPSPGRVAEDTVIDLPRPRAEHLATIMFTPEFREATQGLFERLEGAIAPSGAREGDQS